MSFLLDALKSLERKNRTGSVPDLLTVHETAPGKPGPIRLRIYLATAILLLGAVVLLAWFSPWQSKSPERPYGDETASRQTLMEGESMVEASGAPLLAALSSPGPPRRQLQRPEPPEEITAARPETAPQETPQPVKVEAPVEKPDMQPEPPPIEKIENNRVKPEEISPEENPAQERETSLDEIRDFEALPESVRGELMELAVSGHIYSDDPDLRVAVVNNSVTREGETVANDLKLIEITPEGTVFIYRNHRFLIRKK